jgi:DNA polymerase-3 subunit delta'
VIVLLNFSSASTAAQNALLKLIEEPPANTLIILPIVNEQNLLSTISSRCIHCQIASHQTNNKQSLEETYCWPDNATAIFALVNQYKDREKAKKMIQNLLKQKLSYQQKKALSQAYLDLQANVNCD